MSWQRSNGKWEWARDRHRDSWPALMLLFFFCSPFSTRLRNNGCWEMEWQSGTEQGVEISKGGPYAARRRDKWNYGARCRARGQIPLNKSWTEAEKQKWNGLQPKGKIKWKKSPLTRERSKIKFKLIAMICLVWAKWNKKRISSASHIRKGEEPGGKNWKVLNINHKSSLRRLIRWQGHFASLPPLSATYFLLCGYVSRFKPINFCWL